MSILLKVVFAVQAARIALGYLEVAPLKRPTKVVKATEAITADFLLCEGTGYLPVSMKENTSHSNHIGVSALAGSIPGCEEPGFIPSATEGDAFRKSTGRIGVDKDCSTGSPLKEQRRGKKKRRQTKARSKLHKELTTIVAVEPILVNVSFS